jgi:hypothetical protein
VILPCTSKLDPDVKFELALTEISAKCVAVAQDLGKAATLMLTLLQFASRKLHAMFWGLVESGV